jgi:light-regulated signal transduction histidine kinase (bacteriophytochrome)
MLANDPVERNPLHVLTLPGRGEAPELAVSMHTIDGVAVVELEAASQPDAAAPDYYVLVKKTAARLQSAETMASFGELATQEIRALTGFDRVLIYRFHPDGHGEVVAESRRDELMPWLGLHYPAQDIPQPTREIFRKIWVRPTPDVGAPVHELVPLSRPDNGQPLNMTYCSLRGASVMYTEYLQNMRVRAGLTLAIRREDELWGLIACHHYAGPKQTSWEVRAACEFVAQVISLQHKAVEDREHLLYRLRLDGVHQQLIARAAPEGQLAQLTQGSPTLLDGLEAGGVAVYAQERWTTLGATPTEPELSALSQWLAQRPEFASPTRPLYVTDRLASEYPPAAAYATIASGLLAVPLSRNHRNLVLWFRPQTLQTVRWGGNPDDKPTVPGPHGPRLTPRASFALFVESVRARSLPWKPVEIAAAARLRQLLMELVVARAEQLAEVIADLERSNADLDAFAHIASHDLKEPLRGIHKYAHQLLTDATGLADEQRQRLAGLLRMTVRMDSLLDSLLHFSRLGRRTLELEPVDLNQVLDEAIEMVSSRTSEGSSEFVVPRPLPTVRCDRMRVREVLMNLLSNALKYNVQPHKRIEIGYLAPHEPGAHAAWPPEHTVFYVRDNGIGIERRHFDAVFQMFKRLHGRDEYDGGSGAGLAIVKQVIVRHHGQIWLESTPGLGSTFYFTLGDSGS